MTTCSDAYQRKLAQRHQANQAAYQQMLEHQNRTLN